jgi:hypothetical protein
MTVAEQLDSFLALARDCFTQAVESAKTTPGGLRLVR